jgi:hypothetical protein
MWEMNGPSVVVAAAIGQVPNSFTLPAIGDFNGDGRADLLWRDTTNGWVSTWGPSLIAAAGVGNPGTGWTPVGTGDYNGDGKADILFQNTDGTPMIWTLNGTSITTITTLTDPGENWHAKTG